MQASTAQVLNRVLEIVAQSFPQYIEYARPYVPPGGEHAVDTFHDVAEDQTFMSERIVEALTSGGFVPHFGEFPMDYTSKHDLGIDCLLDFTIARQQRDIERLSEFSETLATAPASRTLVDETLGMAQAHLGLLQAARDDLKKHSPAPA